MMNLEVNQRRGNCRIVEIGYVKIIEGGILVKLENKRKDKKGI